MSGAAVASSDPGEIFLDLRLAEIVAFFRIMRPRVQMGPTGRLDLGDLDEFSST
jgi:hypothetical protein